MRQLVLFCALLLLVHRSTQVAKYENCSEDILIQKSEIGCVRVRCLPAKQGLEIEGCNYITCAIGTKVGYHHGDDTKEYPECCDFPICQE